MRKEAIKNNLIGDRTFYRKVIAILIPIVIQNTVTNVVSLVDNVMVGSVGTLQMSSVAIVNQLLFVFYLCIFGGLAGAGIFATQFAGADDNEGVKHCFVMKIYIGIVMMILAMVVFIAFPNQLINMYIAKDSNPADAANALAYGLEYLKIMLIGLLPFTVAQIYGNTLRELGETKVPMIASVSAIIINVVFNYIFIFGNKGLPFLWFEPMGVAGAAIATVMSRFVEAIIIVVYVHVKHKKFPFIENVFRSLRIPKPLFMSMMRRGMPLLLNEFLWSAGLAYLNQCYSFRGLDVVAAINISATANNLFNVVFMSIGNAVGILVGQQLGANEIEKAKTSVWRLISLSVVTCGVMGTAMAISAKYIPYIYNTTDNVRHMATGFLYVIAFMMPFVSFAHCCYFTLRSGGKTFLTMLFDCVYTWVLSIPLAYCLAHFTSMPIIPMFACVQSLDIVKCILGFIFIKKGIWIHNIVKK